MVKGLTLFTFLLVISTSFVGTSFARSKEKKFEIKNLNFNQLQQARRAYLIFLKKVEKEKQSYPQEYKGEKHTQFSPLKIYLEYLMNSAYAKTGDLCFFGGWPSRMDGNLCQTPWNVADEEEFKKFGSYGPGYACGSPGEFRCNPALFGKPDKTLLENRVSTVNGVKFNRKPYLNGPDKGFCVKTQGTWENLTQKCEEVSRQNIASLVEGYQKDPQKLQNFHDSILGTNGFCAKYEKDQGNAYDACDDLEKRLNAIGLKADAKRDTTTPMAINQIQPNVNYAKDIFDACQNYLDSNPALKDFENRKILSHLNYGEDSCKRKLDKEAEPDYKQILGMANDLDPLVFLRNLNLKKYEANIKALMVNEAVFAGDKSTIPHEDKAKLKAYLKRRYGELSDEEFDKVFNKSFDEVQDYKKKGIIKPLDHQESLKNLNTESKELQNICRSINEEYNNKFGKEGLIEKLIPWNDDEKKFFQANEWRLKSKLKGLLNTPNTGHLFGTETFRENVYDPGQKLIESCVKDEDYQIVKSPIAFADFKAGIRDVKRELQKDLGAINLSQKDIAGGNLKEVKEQIQDFIAGDKSMLLQTLLSNQDEEMQKRMGSYICKETIQIYKDDRFRVMLGRASLATALLGSVLAFTPFAPIAVGFMATGGIGEIGVGISQIKEANRHQEILNTSFTRGALPGQDYINESRRVGQQKTDGKKYVVSGMMSSASFTTRTSLMVYNKLRGAKKVAQTGTSVVVKAVKPTTEVAKYSPKGTSVVSAVSQSTTIAKPSVEVSTKTAQASNTSYQSARATAGVKPERFKNVKAYKDYLKSIKINVIPSKILRVENLPKISKDQAMHYLRLILGLKVNPSKKQIRSLLGRLHPDKSKIKKTSTEFNIVNQLYRKAYPKKAK